MKILKIAAAFVVLVLVVLLSLIALFERIEPGEIGVRQNLWGGGIVPEDFDAGFHLGVVGMHEWHRLDRRTHFLSFSEHTAGGSGPSHRNRMERPPLEIRTVDNNTASLDVTVTFRIANGEANQIVAEGLKETYRDRVASQVVRVLREELAKLAPEDFVNTDTRLALVEETMPKLSEALAKFHVVPESLLIRAVRFPEEYEEKLQLKQLQQQLALLEESKRKVEEKLTETGTIEKITEAMEKEKRAEWQKRLQDAQSENDVRIAGILGEARVYDERVRAQADASYEKLVAEGKLALAQAEALRDQLRNAALDTLGGRIYQAREAARNLRVREVTLNSNDPSVPTILDVDALARLLIGAAPEAGGGD